MNQKKTTTVVLALALTASMAVKASAADYSFETSPAPEYYSSTNYDDQSQQENTSCV